MLTLLVVSDATGATAERMVRAALAQFDAAQVKLVRRSNVRSREQVRAVVEEAAAAEDAIILHTLVCDELRRFMFAEARQRGVDSLDMLGTLLERLASHLRLSPKEMPGLFQERAEAKSREIDAVAFAFRHDDGQNPDELDRAEVVLVGPSRTMKTPTTLYLAYRGWFAANVPLVPGLPLPQKLLSLPAERVFCLLMDPHELQQLRRVRAVTELIPSGSYSALPVIRKEIQYAKRLCREQGWRIVDVTAKSVEEVARDIIALLWPARQQTL